MISKGSAFGLCLTVIIVVSGCRGLLENNVNILETDNVKYETSESGKKVIKSSKLFRGFIIHSENLKPKTVLFTDIEDSKTQQIYKQFGFNNGIGESIEVYTKRVTEVVNPIDSLKRFSKYWKNIGTEELLWGKHRSYDSKYLPIRYRAAELKNSNMKCIFFMSSGPPSKKDHFGRSREFLIGYYCLKDPSFTIQYVEEIFDGFSIDGEGLKNELFSENQKDISALMYYKNDVKIVNDRVVRISKLPLKISDKIENEGSMLSD